MISHLQKVIKIKIKTKERGQLKPITQTQMQVLFSGIENNEYMRVLLGGIPCNKVIFWAGLYNKHAGIDFEREPYKSAVELLNWQLGFDVDVKIKDSVTLQIEITSNRAFRVNNVRAIKIASEVLNNELAGQLRNVGSTGEKIPSLSKLIYNGRLFDIYPPYAMARINTLTRALNIVAPNQVYTNTLNNSIHSTIKSLSDFLDFYKDFYEYLRPIAFRLRLDSMGDEYSRYPEYFRIESRLIPVGLRNFVNTSISQYPILNDLFARYPIV